MIWQDIIEKEKKKRKQKQKQKQKQERRIIMKDMRKYRRIGKSEKQNTTTKSNHNRQNEDKTEIHS